MNDAYICIDCGDVYWIPGTCPHCGSDKEPEMETVQECLGDHCRMR